MLLRKIKRIVLKIGTSSLTHRTGKFNYRHVEDMVAVVCDLKNRGFEIVIVSSGACGIGVGKVNLNKKPDESSKKRALAATGQSGLMAVYEELFSSYHCQVAQVLLTKSALKDADNRKNIVKAFSEMFEYGVLPIVNENDVEASDKKGSDDLFGDNDTLSAYVAEFVKADMLIIWSDIDGLYNKDPRKNPDASLIHCISKIDEHVYEMAGGTGTLRGSGGMLTKLNAARLVMNSGINMVIANSSCPDNLYEIIDGKEVGTLFKASE